jgi:hypothetical protein
VIYLFRISPSISTESDVVSPAAEPPVESPALTQQPVPTIVTDNTEDPSYQEMAAYFLDAFLVFRAFCRLSIKPLPEGTADAKAYALKSKILSLHLLNLIVQNHFSVITSTFPIVVGSDSGQEKEDGDGKDMDSGKQVTNFVNGIKHYLCVSLSRNAVSLVPDVLDRSLEIFFRLVIGMRHWLKVRSCHGFVNFNLMGLERN